MKQEFVTLYGKAVIERNTLFLRSPYLPFGKTAFAEISMALVWVSIFVLQFFYEYSPRKYVGIVLWGLLLISRIPYIINILFKRSYAKRIPLANITSIQSEEDHHGLQVTLTLHLKNGRLRQIIFRKLENQHDSFIQTITPPLSVSQLKSA